MHAATIMGIEMTLSRQHLRELIAALERQHGEERGLWPRQRFALAVHFDDGAEYQLRWPRGARNPAWEISRRR